MDTQEHLKGASSECKGGVMEVKILREAGYQEALLGLSLSHNQPVERMPAVAQKLCSLEDGHNKFLESICLWLDVSAPRYWWQQFDTYRVGVTKQSQSTMHTILHRCLTQDDFESPLASGVLRHLNLLIEQKDFNQVKHDLPEGFLQRRVVVLNYKVIRRIIRQRNTHRLIEWRVFISLVVNQLEHLEFVVDLLR